MPLAANSLLTNGPPGWRVGGCSQWRRSCSSVLGAVGFLGSQVLLFGQPLLTLFADAPSIDEFATVLDDPDLLAQIERRLTDADRSTL